MDVRGVRLNYLFAQQFNKRRRDDPVLRDPFGKFCYLGGKCVARFSDPRRGLRGDHTEDRLCAGQRLLEGENRANVGFGRKRA